MSGGSKSGFFQHAASLMIDLSCIFILYPMNVAVFKELE